MILINQEIDSLAHREVNFKEQMKNYMKLILLLVRRGLPHAYYLDWSVNINEMISNEKMKID